MIALAQFIVILLSVLFSKYFFSRLVETSKKELEEKKEQKLKYQKEYEIRLSQKKAADKTPYELKLDELKKQEEEISNLKKEAEQFNNTDSYAKYSKIQRQVLKLNQQLEKDRQGLEQLKIQDELVKSSATSNENSEEEQQWKQQQSELTSQINILVNKESSIKQKERVVNGVMPLMCIFLFSNFPILLKVNVSSTLWPLNLIVADTEENVSIFSKTIWVFICFRVVSIIYDYFIKKPKSSTENKKEN